MPPNPQRFIVQQQTGRARDYGLIGMRSSVEA